MSPEGIGNDESLRLTRSSTIFHALIRIFGSGKLPSHLVLHIVGADHREGAKTQQTKAVFMELFQRLGQHEHVRELDLLFCGPNIAPHLHDSCHSFLHHYNPPAAKKEQNVNIASNHGGDKNIHGADSERQQSQPTTPGTMTSRLCDPSTFVAGALAVHLRYNSGLYHDVSDLFATPDTLFLFNAGLWGYDDWEPTLEHVLGCDCSRSEGTVRHYGCDDNQSVPLPTLPPTKPETRNAPAVVVTSYCSEEASDDMETIQRVLLGDDERCKCLLGSSPRAASSPETVEDGGLDWLWKPEVNFHRSRVPRHTECGVVGRVLFENHSWQALRPLRCRSYTTIVLKGITK